MASIEFDKVSRIYDGGIPAVHDFNLKVNDSELMVLVGPSGCGKSTLLRMVAGLEEISSGEIRIDNQVVNQVPPQKRHVAMVFQNYALYPHMTVRGNLEFPLRMQKQQPKEIEGRVMRIAEMLDLVSLLERKPKALSGGQRQRVAMGRAIIRDASIFLMDEPLSNLDARLRVQIRADIARLQRELAITTLYVTHDQTEAMTLGQRLAVINQGVLQQVGTPLDIYEHPANTFVAQFIGTPGMNLVRASLQSERGEVLLDLGALRLSLPQQIIARLSSLSPRWDQGMLVGIRPHAIQIADHETENTLAVQVYSVETMGHETVLYLESALPMLPPDEADQDGNTRPAQLTALFKGHRQYRAGEQLMVVIAPEELYFFNLNGQAGHHGSIRR
jgi:multiple sugar transport system ATP-binding protein